MRGRTFALALTLSLPSVPVAAQMGFMMEAVSGATTQAVIEAIHGNIREALNPTLTVDSAQVVPIVASSSAYQRTLLVNGLQGGSVGLVCRSSP